MQAINKTFTDLEEQIQQAAHIIGIPEGWENLQDYARSAAVQNLACARADWVLRWILEKLKDTSEGGAKARAHVKAWKLLDWMIEVLPVSRCAPHLRDADFLTILEKALKENFDADPTFSIAPGKCHKSTRRTSDSSETVQEDSTPSRKRKRSSGANIPSKRNAIGSSVSTPLFDGLRAAVLRIRDKVDPQGSSEEMVQSEHMKMVLRTESAQASRILKIWLNAVQLILAELSTDTIPEGLAYLDLSPIVDIWQYRAIDPQDDSGSSVEQFSTECLLPSLLLSQTLQGATDGGRNLHVLKAINEARITLDRLLAKHILMPSRTAFFDAFNAEVSSEAGANSVNAALLSNSLSTLEAKILQAAQIEDGGATIPIQLAPVFDTVPHLLELIIRCSPARTSKARTAEKPWIQSSLIILAKCLGFSLQPSDFPASGASVASLEQCLHILAAHHISIDTQVLQDLFWYHTGLKYPLNQNTSIQWSLIAALIEIDSSIFLTDPKSAHATKERPTDLAVFLFDQISLKLEVTAEDGDAMDLDTNHGSATPDSDAAFGKEQVLGKIIMPIMSAFARNRQLLGFVDRWDDQLRKTVQTKRKPLAGLTTSIWEDRALTLGLSHVLEQSLTTSQTATLFEEHVERLGNPNEGDAAIEAASSAVIIQAILRSIESEETIEALKPHMLSAWAIYGSWVRSDETSHPASLTLAWNSLHLLAGWLWPIHLHESKALQKELVRPLLEQASQDASSARKESNRRLDSSSRAAAIAFVFITCDFLSTLPDSTELVKKRLRKTMKALSPGQLEAPELKEMAKLFSAEFTHLLGSFELEDAQGTFSVLLETVSAIDLDTDHSLIESLSDSVFSKGNPSLKAAFTAALLGALEKDAERLRTSSIHALLRVSPSSLAREQREDILNKLLELLDSAPGLAPALLNIMVHFMEVPNATSKISSSGSSIFDIAQALHGAEAEGPAALQMLQKLAQSTLVHLIPNRDQAQCKIFFEKFENKIASCLKKPKTCTMSKLAILQGTLLAAQDLESLLPAAEYVEFLAVALKKGVASPGSVLEAYNNIPSKVLEMDTAVLGSAQSSLRKWMSPKMSFHDAEDVSIKSFPMEVWPSVVQAVAKYQLYPTTKWLIRLASQLLVEDLYHGNTLTVLECVKDALSPVEPSEKLALVPYSISTMNKAKPAVAYQMLHAIISSMNDKLDLDTQSKEKQLAVLPQICSLLGNSQNEASFNTLLDSINTILLDKPNMVSQHTIENVLAVLLKLSTRSSPRLSSNHASAIYARLCETTRLVLLLHRSRLGGRFHLLLPLLQSLLLCLFIPNANRGAALPRWLDSALPSTPTRLTPANASQYAKLLATLSTPTQSSVQRTRSATTLNDPIKAAREYAAQHVYPLLSSLCRYQLYGRLDAEVRSKLMPGVWDVIALGQLDKEGIDAMFAGLGRSEKDVWRGVWAEYVRTQGRKDRKRKEDA